MNKTHGMCGTKVYRTWCGIKKRCLNKNDSSYKKYGAKGIICCDKWMSFECFYRDMGEPPTDLHTIDRLNPKEGYNKENCRWTTIFQQGSENKTDLRMFTINGETMNLAAWERRLGFNCNTLRGRIWRGMSFEDAVKMGLPKKNKYSGIRLKNDSPRKKKWQAYVKKDGKQLHVGYFTTKTEARKARDIFINQKLKPSSNFY